ncbi:hypothetical protein DFQ26_003695 [Actinomortierella ambigua]|nr:hypothetical protein DFQ26_003695 [Actinomortierella ambigua]
MVFIDALTNEDKPEASAKVEKDHAKGMLIQEAALWLWARSYRSQEQGADSRARGTGLSRALALNYKKMNLMLEDRADNQLWDLELASGCDQLVYYFQADMEGCLADVRKVEYATDILAGADNFIELYRLRNAELNSKGKSTA